MIYKLMKPVYIFERINEFMIIIIRFVINIQLLINSSFFYWKISTTMIYKLMKHVCIFNIIIEFMIITINGFSVMILLIFSY